MSQSIFDNTYLTVNKAESLAAAITNKDLIKDDDLTMSLSVDNEPTQEQQSLVTSTITISNHQQSNVAPTEDEIKRWKQIVT